jgi:hypothetical protein
LRKQEELALQNDPWLQPQRVTAWDAALRLAAGESPVLSP